MIYTAYDERHQVGLGAHIGIHHHHMLRGCQYQNSYPGYVGPIMFFSEETGITQSSVKRRASAGRRYAQTVNAK